MEITRTEAPFHPAELERIAELVDSRRGGVLSSGMEYPGRYSRWRIAYVDPAIEIVATGRRLTARALNERGQVILPVVRAALLRAGQAVDEGRGGLGGRLPPVQTVLIPEPDGTGAEDAAPEEERTRRPTVFSALREIVAAFR